MLATSENAFPGFSFNHENPVDPAQALGAGKETDDYEMQGGEDF
jgi:hypothetical protein